MSLLTRRTLLRSAAAALPVLAAPAPAARPGTNIILIVLDDLGYGQFGPNSDMFDLNQINPLALQRAGGTASPAQALAQAQAATPNLSRLAAEGTRFTDGYVACPLCAPSRSGLMTSRYPQRFGVYINEDINQVGLPREELMLPRVFQQGGYATAAIGKWHMASNRRGGMEPGSGQHPLDRGFDYFFGFNGPGSPYYDSDILYRNREKAAAGGYLTEQFTEEAIGFLNRSRNRPFFLYLPYNAVHGPLGRPAPGRYLQKFKTGDRRLDNFYAYLNAADDGVGRIRRLLSEQGRENNTVIFVLSDNGAPGASPLPANGPFFGFKGQVWQGGLRVPMAAWGPGVIPAGQICRQPVISLDILPTALAAAGLALPSGYTVDGRNMLPLLAGREKQLHPNLFWAGQLSQRWAGAKDAGNEPPAWAVRKGRWMLRYWSHLKRFEVYDLDTDRGERHDLAPARPEIVKELKADYAAWFAGIRKPLAWDENDWRLLTPTA